MGETVIAGLVIIGADKAIVGSNEAIALIGNSSSAQTSTAMTHAASRRSEAMPFFAATSLCLAISIALIFIVMKVRARQHSICDYPKCGCCIDLGLAKRLNLRGTVQFITKDD